jgi:1,4-dihydroxy-2-naphthoate octaprenyltransferase
MPIFLFALGISVKPQVMDIVLVFIILHAFIYPASNGYNSYFDKDEKSIGGLENPPAVSKELYYTSLLFDLIGTILALIISWQFAVMVFIYGMVSKAYSHPHTRLKKYPWGSWLITGFFQGFFTFWMVYMALNHQGFPVILDPKVLIAAALSTITLWGSYPMTQIYQHEEDMKRGDITLSYLLGIKGTFLFTGTVFLIATIGYFVYFFTFYQFSLFLYFLVCLTPILVYFSLWFVKVLKDERQADFRHTMRLNMISSIALSAFFVLLFFVKNHS